MLAVEPEPNPLWDLVFGRDSEWWRGADARRRRFAAALRRGLARRAGDRRVRCRRRRRRRPAGRGRARYSGGARSTGHESAVRADQRSRRPGAAPAPITLIATDPAGSPGLREQLESAGHRVSEVDPAAFAAAPLAGALRTTPRDVGRDRGRSWLDEGDDPVEQAARLIAILPRAGGGRCAPADPAVDRDDRGAAGRAERFLRWRGAGIRPALSGPRSGVLRGCCSTRPRVCRCGSSISRRAMDAAERGARAGRRSWRRQRPETEIVWTRSGRHVPRLRRGLPPRWAAPGDALALDAATAGRHRRAALAADRPASAGTGGGFDRRACRRAQFPRRDVGDGAAARGGADRRLRRRRPSASNAPASSARSGPGSTDLAVGDRVAGFAPAALATRVTTAAHARHPHPGRDELRGGGDDPGGLRHRDLCARHSGETGGRRDRADPCRRRRGRAGRDPVREASRRGRDRDRRVGGETGLSASGRRRPCARIRATSVLPTRCARSPAGAASMSC